MTNSESPVSPAVQERHPYGRLIAMAAASLLLLNGCETNGDAPDIPPAAATTASPDIEYVTPGCINVTSDEIAKVRNTLRASPDEHVLQHNRLGQDKMLGDEQFRVWQHAVAQQNGFTLKDSPTNNMNQGERDMFLDNTPATFYGVADFVKDYGVTLTVPNSEKLLDGIDASPINLAKFWTDRNAAARLLDLRDIIQKYPTDYFKRLDINEIALVEGDKDVALSNDKKLIVGGEVNLGKHPHAIYLSYESTATLDHEMEHVVDYQMGCDERDLGFEVLNEGVDVYADKTPRGVYSEESFFKENKKRSARAQPPLGYFNIYNNDRLCND
jgi:hypothetical protein